MSAPLDARVARPLGGGASFSLRHRLLRALWGVTWLLLARWTPPVARRWRIALLNLFGARVSSEANVYASVAVWYPPHLSMDGGATLGPGVQCYCMDRVHIGRGAVVSLRAFLCGGTHDVDDADFQLVTRPIHIGDHAWIAAEAFVGPGVTVGPGAVLGARGVATRELDAWTVYVGNPARAVRRRKRVGA
ncbi:MAG: putative colanic acid biosynthesis acetyltransferase [Candidatus Devosia phytovorans]|uniref:Colanic acid biosynthesis acetyltransferase n=1 Tax=Candidatus Devosia phytovorans TaxID=3121372 RepID=A0AAJ5VXF1_9HYPH|nr:putative colanic acid biosynthesis acetyltransferase [Devosia sp.]WEK05685.1 MAG: putative colanic acid biosynthesis acetyltransferase [Devosia sp.]